MKKSLKYFIKNKIAKNTLLVIVGLLILIAGFFVCYYLCFNFFHDGKKDYRIENKYYGFELRAPDGWVAEKKTTYSEDSIAQIVENCKNDNSINSSVYEIGKFRFKSQRYPEDFVNLGAASGDFPSGSVLCVVVNCIPTGIDNKIRSNIFNDFKIGGEKTVEREIDLVGFGKTKQISFLHNNLQYKITEGIYISPKDKENEGQLKNDYSNDLSEIISSFKFIN